MSFAQYSQQAKGSNVTSLPMRPKLEEKEAEERGPIEKEPAATKMAEKDCRPRKQYRKRDPLADYNKPPVPKSSAAENQADSPSEKPKKRRNPLADYNKPPVPKSSAAENQADGPSNKPKTKRDTLADFNKPPVLKSSAAEIKRTRPNPLAKPKPTTAGEKNHQAGSSNGPACSKKTTTTITVGEKGRVGKANAAGAKSNRTEELSNTPTTSRQLAGSNGQTPTRGVENTFLCFFCSKTKDVRDRQPGRLNTCSQCHTYYMAQVAGR